MSGRTGVFSAGMCPRCGATASHQKFRPRGGMDLGGVDLADGLRAEDGVICPRCGEGFRVSHLETWDGRFVNYEDEFECVPNYCPMCGERLRDLSFGVNAGGDR